MEVGIPTESFPTTKYAKVVTLGSVSKETMEHWKRAKGAMAANLFKEPGLFDTYTGLTAVMGSLKAVASSKLISRRKLITFLHSFRSPNWWQGNVGAIENREIWRAVYGAVISSRECHRPFAWNQGALPHSQLSTSGACNLTFRNSKSPWMGARDCRIALRQNELPRTSSKRAGTPPFGCQLYEILFPYNGHFSRSLWDLIPRRPRYHSTENSNDFCKCGWIHRFSAPNPP